jgi:hypothetical protein
MFAQIICQPSRAICYLRVRASQDLVIRCFVIHRRRIRLNQRCAWEEECWTERVEVVSMVVFMTIAGVNGCRPRDGICRGEVRCELLQSVLCAHHDDGSREYVRGWQWNVAVPRYSGSVPDGNGATDAQVRRRFGMWMSFQCQETNAGCQIQRDGRLRLQLN